MTSYFEGVAAALCDLTTPADVVLKALTELRERLDVVHTPDYALFLRTLVPPFVYVLTKRVRPEMEDNILHKCARTNASLVSVRARVFCKLHVSAYVTVGLCVVLESAAW